MRAFLKSEHGGILPFVLVVSVTVILMGALTVNTVRVEHRRSVTQSVLDICVLNSAAQRQKLAPRTALDDCLTKHGFEATITNFNAETGRRKSVTATANTSLQSFFLAEPETYSVAVSSSASEESTNLEIVLALDVSSSMGTTAFTPIPLQAMKDAANTFVETMLKDDDQGRVTITLLPYSTHVNLGAEVAAQFNLTNVPQNYAFGGPDVSEMRCADPPTGSFNSTAIVPTEALRALSFVDIDGSTNQGTLRDGPIFVSPTAATTAVARVQSAPCVMWRDPPTAANNIIRLPDFKAAANSPALTTVADRTAALKTKINSLIANGETSINLGMRWALAFLDPAMRPVFQAFSGAGRIPATSSDRPLDFVDPSAIKVVVLMTDGANSAEFRLKDSYASGDSPFWLGNDGNYSWFNSSRAGADKYWVPHTATWQATPWQNATNTGAAAQRLDYRELWHRLKVQYVTWQFHARSVSVANTAAGRTARSTANTAALAEYRTGITAATKDTQLTDVCSIARSRGVYVYTIAFNTGEPLSTVLPTCATTPAQHYTATPSNIAAAFAAIALHITRLQLEQ